MHSRIGPIRSTPVPPGNNRLFTSESRIKDPGHHRIALIPRQGSRCQRVGGNHLVPIECQSLNRNARVIIGRVTGHFHLSDQGREIPGKSRIGNGINHHPIPESEAGGIHSDQEVGIKIGDIIGVVGVRLIGHLKAILKTIFIRIHCQWISPSVISINEDSRIGLYSIQQGVPITVLVERIRAVGYLLTVGESVIITVRVVRVSAGGILLRIR